MQLDISSIDCSKSPAYNSWLKLGMSKEMETIITPIMCPKAVYMVLTGPESRKIMTDCVSDKAKFLTQPDNCSPSNHNNNKSRPTQQFIIDCIKSLALQNLESISSSSQLIGVQFIITFPAFTPYIATMFSDNSMAAAFHHQDHGTVITHSSSTNKLLTFIQTHGAKHPFPVACANCGAASRLKKCARCSGVLYCGKECQREHWMEHKVVCKKM